MLYIQWLTIFYNSITHLCVWPYSSTSPVLYLLRSLSRWTKRKKQHTTTASLEKLYLWHPEAALSSSSWKSECFAFFGICIYIQCSLFVAPRGRFWSCLWQCQCVAFFLGICISFLLQLYLWRPRATFFISSWKSQCVAFFPRNISSFQVRLYGLAPRGSSSEQFVKESLCNFCGFFFWFCAPRGRLFGQLVVKCVVSPYCVGQCHVLAYYTY